VKKLNVTYTSWGERSPLGVLADTGTDLLFEYSAEGPANTMRSESPIIWQVAMAHVFAPLPGDSETS
jgi:hypothetical protein